MQWRTSFSIAAIALASLLAGCATAPPSGAPSVPTDLSQLTQWEARGRLGVSSAERGGSGTFTWGQHRDEADVQIRGPIGIGSVRLQMSGSSSQPELKLETSDGQVFRADSAWSELEARLGAPVPAGKLRYWMLGLPAPGEHQWAPDPDPASDLATLEQDGWRIEYRYSDKFGPRLPQSIRAARGDARVRIVVDRWSLEQ
jgi:outer membrane lipoprotein LolB